MSAICLRQLALFSVCSSLVTLLSCSTLSAADIAIVAETTAEAKRLARQNSLESCLPYILDLTRATSPSGVTMWKSSAQQADSECNLDYLLNDVVIAGEHESVTRQLLDLRDRVGAFGSLVLTAHNWDDRSTWISSLTLFADEVVPAFNLAIGSTSQDHHT